MHSYTGIHEDLYRHTWGSVGPGKEEPPLISPHSLELDVAAAHRYVYINIFTSICCVCIYVHTEIRVCISIINCQWYIHTYSNSTRIKCILIAYVATAYIHTHTYSLTIAIEKHECLWVCTCPYIYKQKFIIYTYCSLQNNLDSFQRFQRSFVPDYYRNPVEMSPNYFASCSSIKAGGHQVSLHCSNSIHIILSL